MDRFVGKVNEDDDAPDRATERRARLGGVTDDAGGCAWWEVGLGDDDSVVQTESVWDLYWEDGFSFWSIDGRIVSGHGILLESFEMWRISIHPRAVKVRHIYKHSPQTHCFRSMKGSM